MYAWELSFQEHIVRIRNKELDILKKLAYYNSAMAFIWICTPFLVSGSDYTYKSVDFIWNFPQYIMF